MFKSFKVNLSTAVLSSFILVVVVYLIKRLCLGVDLTDEALYNALPLSFSRGRLPFIDELIVIQSYAILLIPLTDLFNRFSPNSEGIVLFFRVCYFSLTALVSLKTFFFLNKYIPRLHALMASLVILSFWPFSIPSLSYNTLGMLFLFLGQVYIFEQSEENKLNYKLPAGIIFLLLSIFCYPSMALASVFVFLFYAIRIYRLKFTSSIFYFSLSLLLLFAFLMIYFLFIYTSLNRLNIIFTFIKAYGVHATFLSKVKTIISQFFNDSFFILFILLFTLTPSVLEKVSIKYKQFSILVLTFIMAFFFYQHQFNALTMPAFHTLFLSISIASVILSLIKRKYFTISILIFISGSICAWTSSNGLTNFAIGSLASIIFFSILLFHGSSKNNMTAAICFIIIFSLLIFQLKSLKTSVYGDDSNIQNLNQKVEFGAFKGLYTTDSKIKFINQLTTDLVSVSESGKNIAFFDFFSGGPLFTQLKMNTPMIWTNSLSQFPQDRSILADFYTDKKSFPDILVWFDFVPVASYFRYDLHHNKQDLLKEKLLAAYTKQISREEYVVYIKKSE